MLFSVFERAKIQNKSMASEKKWFFVKKIENNSLILVCLFKEEYLILRSKN